MGCTSRRWLFSKAWIRKIRMNHVLFGVYPFVQSNPSCRASRWMQWNTKIHILWNSAHDRASSGEDIGRLPRWQLQTYIWWYIQRWQRSKTPKLGRMHGIWCILSLREILGFILPVYFLQFDRGIRCPHPSPKAIKLLFQRCTVLRRTAECTILYIRTRKPQSNLHEKDVPVFVSREEAGFCCWSDWTYLLWLILCGSCLEPLGRVINEIAFSTRVLDEHFFQSINLVIMNFQWLSLTSTCLKWSPKLSPKLSDAG